MTDCLSSDCLMTECLSYNCTSSDCLSSIYDMLLKVINIGFIKNNLFINNSGCNNSILICSLNNKLVLLKKVFKCVFSICMSS